ncbi:glutamine-hydrolyzing carbamoyl-phosphate synthase small subunit [Thermoflexus sp.]|uniref:glutamine-hydrolyzing carbamoyl-phosphate synthase small subunit n=1 Tax=Thermoflexus sp. TaxID=1969742 RepID=UPI0035E42595
MRGILALEDGTVFVGRAFGARATVVGEVVFNTAMTGYQEILTDPSYRGQMVVMTCTQIGNVGVNAEDVESDRPQVTAFIVRALSPVASNWRAAESLGNYLARHGIPGLSEVDTRALTRLIRTRGAMKGALSTEEGADPEALVEMARSWEGLEGRDMVREVTCSAPYEWSEGSGCWQPHGFNPDPHPRRHVVVYDFGVKRSILRRLVDRGCRVTVVPADTPAGEVLRLQPDGIVLSNGPGDPAGLPGIVETVRQLLEARIPIFGICLGHQLIAQAIGARTYKLPFGHHGSNHPVREEATGRVRITAQNHNYAVDPDTIDPQRAIITHVNLNDGTVEGLALRDRPVFSVQYHPEANPGPHDADPLFDQWVKGLGESGKG